MPMCKPCTQVLVLALVVMIAIETAPIFLIKEMLPLQRSKSKLSQFGIAAVFIPYVFIIVLELTIELELTLVLVLAIGKELQLELALGKDYLVQCPHHLERASARARASTRERLFSSVSLPPQKN